MKSELVKKLKSSWLVYVAAVFAVIGLVVYFIFFVKLIIDGFVIWGKVDPILGGSIGDFLSGVVGSVFTLVGAILLFATLKLQRDASAEQQRAFQQQQEQIKMQQFESTFFSLLNLLQDIVKSMHYNWGQDAYSGRRYLEYCFRDLAEIHVRKTQLTMISWVLDVDAKKNQELLEKYADEVSQSYESFYKEHQAQLGHYFRFIYNIIKYILANLDNEVVRKKYIDIIQSQLSSYELGLLFYNSLSVYGGNKLHSWLDKYQFLENIDKQCVLKPELDHLFYPQTKFKYRIFDEDKQ